MRPGRPKASAAQPGGALSSRRGGQVGETDGVRRPQACRRTPDLSVQDAAGNQVQLVLVASLIVDSMARVGTALEQQRCVVRCCQAGTAGREPRLRLPRCAIADPPAAASPPSQHTCARATISYFCARMSTSFPLPSSPHCMPRTTQTWGSKGASSRGASVVAAARGGPTARVVLKRLHIACCCLFCLRALCKLQERRESPRGARRGAVPPHAALRGAQAPWRFMSWSCIVAVRNGDGRIAGGADPLSIGPLQDPVPSCLPPFSRVGRPSCILC